MTDTTALLARLHALIQRLQSESADFLDNHQDAQAWYNRGYAAGMIAALTELGHAEQLQDVARDDPTLMHTHGVMSWGQAYRHGHEMGERETYEVLAPERPHAHALPTR